MNLQQYGQIFWKFLIFSFGFAVISCVPLESEDANESLLHNMRLYMDPKADPCQSFYTYSCGNWNKSSEYSNIIQTQGIQYNNLMDTTLVEKLNNDNEIVNKLRDFYESCEQQNAFTVAGYLDSMKPTETDDWPEDGKSWQPQAKWNIWSTMGELAAVGVHGPFFKVNLQVDRKDQTYRAVFDTNAISSFMLIFREASDMTAKVVKFNDAICDQIVVDATSPRLEMTIPELQQQVVTIDFVAYFSALLGHDNFSNITVSLKNVDSLRKMGELVQAESQDVLIQLAKKLFVYHMEKELIFNCFDIVKNVAPLGMNYMYEQMFFNHYRQRDEELMAKVFKALKQTYVDAIQENRNEFSAQVVAAMLEKITNMKLQIGNLPQGVAEHIYAKFFENWQVVKNDFYGNHLRAMRRRNVDSYELLQLPEFKPILSYRRDTLARPAYFEAINTIVIPYRYIRFPVIDWEFHDLYANAELGRSLGEAILTALYNDATFRDVTANPKFTDAMSCMKQHTIIPEETRLTLKGTSIDVAAFQLAYETNFKQATANSETSDFSNQQLFFIRYAQSFCQRMSSYTSHGYFNDDYVRVANIMAHSRAFKEAFSCPAKEAVTICNLL